MLMEEGTCFQDVNLCRQPKQRFSAIFKAALHTEAISEKRALFSLKHFDLGTHSIPNSAAAYDCQ